MDGVCDKIYHAAAENRKHLTTKQVETIGISRPILTRFVESGKLLTRSEEQISATLEDYIVFELDGGVHACAALHFGILTKK